MTRPTGRPNGRPVIGRSAKALGRDIATLRRLRRSIEFDERVKDVESARMAVSLIDRLITSLQLTYV